VRQPHPTSERFNELYRGKTPLDVSPLEEDYVFDHFIQLMATARSLMTSKCSIHETLTAQLED
jgi:hypothetical protein